MLLGLNSYSNFPAMALSGFFVILSSAWTYLPRINIVLCRQFYLTLLFKSLEIIHVREPVRFADSVFSIELLLLFLGALLLCGLS